MSAEADAPVDRCPDCGGSWLAGRVAVPVLGALRFVCRVGTTEVGTEVAARLCGDCGRIDLRATDPDVIRRAQHAAKLGRTTPRWKLPPRS
jgi:hypothetical protein